jgi:MYXO-CTERM domain-containing protein
VRTDEMLSGGRHAAAFRRAFVRHGLWPSLAQPANVDPSRLEPVAVSHASPSPIPNRADGELVIEQPGVQAMRVRFATLDMEMGSCTDGGSQCDGVYLYDRDGEVYARLGGKSTGTLSPIIPGDKVTVRWVTTASVQSVGFTIDQVQVLRGAALPDAGTPDAGVTTADARPDRPVTGDAQGGCQAGSGSPGLAPAGLALWALAAAARRRRRRA